MKWVEFMEPRSARRKIDQFASVTLSISLPEFPLAAFSDERRFSREDAKPAKETDS
jgi:hypothetical protein